MKDLRGRVAVVTGGGNGIGEALVLSLARAGMSVAVADVEEASAERVAANARAIGVRALAVRTDVSDPEAVNALADRVEHELGTPHVLCNNAGVLLFGRIADMSLDDWRWVFAVNVFGVVHGVAAFLPRIKALAQREWSEGREPVAHIVNTSSVAALGGEGVYGASKSAVLAISESLRSELESEGIGVSVLCPAYVNSKILGAQRNRSASFGERAPDPMGTDEVTTGLPASSVGDAAVAAIRENRAYVFTYPESMTKRIRPGAEERFRAILEAIEAGEEPNPR